MFIRCAFFKGTIKSGMEEDFHNHWRDNLVPLWSAFPHLLELRVLRDIESDCAESRFPLVMAMRFEISQPHRRGTCVSHALGKQRNFEETV